MPERVEPPPPITLDRIRDGLFLSHDPDAAKPGRRTLAGVEPPIDTWHAAFEGRREGAVVLTTCLTDEQNYGCGRARHRVLSNVSFNGTNSATAPVGFA